MGQFVFGNLVLRCCWVEKSNLKFIVMGQSTDDVFVVILFGFYFYFFGVGKFRVGIYMFCIDGEYEEV